MTRATSPSSAWRSTSSSARGRRCSAAASCRSASRRTRTPARSAWGCPGACPWPTREAIHFGLMIGLALGLRARAALDLPPQELLLSRPAEGLPDLPVRRAPVPRRAAGRRAHPPRAPRGGRGQARPRRRERPHPRLGRDASSTSTAAARRWPRSSPSPTCARPSRPGEWLRLLRTTLRQLGVSDVNMEEGSLRCDANISLRPAGSAELGTKTELKNMNSFRFIERGIRAEIARQEALLRGRRAGRPGDAALRPAHGGDHVAALQGGGARLPLLPRARPAAGGDRRGDARRARARRCPSCPADARGALRARPRAERRQRAAAGVPHRAGDYFEAALGADGDAAPRSRWPTGSPSWPRARTRRTRPTRSVEPAALAALVGLVAGARSVTRERGAAGARPARRRGRRPGGDRRAPRASARSAPATSSSRSSPPRSRRNPDVAEQAARGQHQADRRDRRPRHARDPRPGGRRGGHAAGPRAPRR